MMSSHFKKAAHEAIKHRPRMDRDTGTSDTHNLPVLQVEQNVIEPISGFQLTHEEKQHIQPHFCMMICGKPGSGKTTLVKKLVESPELYKDRFDRILVISPSLGKMGFHVPQEFSHGEFDLEWIFNNIHEFNLRQEQQLMEYLRSEDENAVVQNTANKHRVQQLLEETIQSQRILNIPQLQRVISGFNTRFSALGGKLGPILGGAQTHNLPKPKGCVNFDMVPSCFIDKGAQSGGSSKMGDQPSLRKMMLQGQITKKQMTNLCSDKVNEITEYANQVQTLYLSMVASEELLRHTHLNVLLVLDDVAGDIKGGEFDPSLIKLFFNRRHLIANGTLSIITVTQKFSAIPQKIRTICSWIIFFRLNPIETETVWKDAVVLSRQQWQELLDKVFETDRDTALGTSITTRGDRRYDNLGIWTEFPDVFFENFKLLQ